MSWAQTEGVVSHHQDQEFSVFFREHFARLVRVVRPIARDAAEDVAQDAFAALFERWPDVSKYDVPWAWVSLVARRMAMRRGSRDARRELLQRQAIPAMAAPQGRIDVQLALADLPGRQASALVMHHLLDRPLSEVAEHLSCSEAAARVLVHRSRRRLAENLSGYAGRWITEADWTVDAIVAHLRDHDGAAHLGVVLDQHLDGRGGRWEFTLEHGTYLLRRDDGLQLDSGSFVLKRNRVVLSPTIAPGKVSLAATVDGDQLWLSLLENTTPPTDGVPDDVWMRLFLAASPFTWNGRVAAAV